jgi:lysophospholipase L1-like esterase
VIPTIRITQTLLAGLAAFLICALVGEAYLRAASYDPHRHYIRPPGSFVYRYPDQENFPGASPQAITTINNLGLRGDMPNWLHRRHILALGSSTTDDELLSLDKTWVFKLQTLLPYTWVGNAGRSGTTPRHHILQLPEILPYLPKLDEVVMLIGLLDMLFDAGVAFPPGLGEDWFWRQAFGHQPPRDEGILSKFRLYYRLQAKLKEINPPAAARGSTVPPVQTYRSVRRQVPAFIDETPDLSNAVAQYEQNLRTLASLITKAGARPVFVTSPTLWQKKVAPAEDRLIYMGGRGNPAHWKPDTPWYSPGALAHMLNLYNEATLRVCTALSLQCVDLAAAIPKTATYFYDDVHFSEAGAHLAAETIAAHLKLDRAATSDTQLRPHVSERQTN